MSKFGKPILKPFAESIVGPFGDRLTRDNLPERSPRRWVVRRKAEVAAAVLGGLITRAEVESRYGVDEQELSSWMKILKQLD